MFAGLVRWLIEPLEGKPELKCSNCGSEVSLEMYTCRICGYTISHIASSNEHVNMDVFDAEHSTIESVEGEEGEGLGKEDAHFWYEKARSECKGGLLENSITSLQKAIELDRAYATIAEIADAHDFQPLRRDPRFQELVRKRREELEQLITITQ